MANETLRGKREQLALVVALGAFGTLSLSLLAPILPDLATATGAGRAMIGWVQGAVAIPGIVFSMIIGYLADRFGRRAVVLVSVVVFTSFGVAGFWARSFGPLVGLRVLQGTATSGLLGLSIALIGDLFDGSARTRALGINMVGTTVISILAPITSGVVAEGGPFRPFLLYLVGVPLGIWALRLEVPETARAPSNALWGHLSSARHDLRVRGTAWTFAAVLVATLAMVMVLHGVTSTAVPLILSGDFDAPSSLRGLVVSAFQIGAAVIALFVVRVRLSRGPGGAFTLGFAAMSAGLAIQSVSPTVAVFALGVGIAGAGFGMVVPTLQQYATEAASPAFRGVVVLTWVTVVRLAQSIGPPVASTLTDTAGSRSALLVATAGTGAIALSWRRLRLRLPHPPAPPIDVGADGGRPG